MRVTWALREIPPPVPVIVRVYVPGSDRRLTETLSVEVAPPDGTGFELQEAVVRLGRPLTPSCTLPVNPPLRLIVAV
jgi:hypothetical protein